MVVKPVLPPFQVLIDQHARDVHRYLIGLVGPHAAEDCLHEALMSAMAGYGRMRHAGNLRGWLFTIAHRKGIDHLRKASREQPAAVLPEEPVTDAGPADPAVWSRVAALPDKQRAAIMLRYVGDLTYAAIGQIIDCSEPAARQNVAAALATLRKEMV